MELKAMKEERLSTQKCLLICDQLSEHIDQIQLTTRRTRSSDDSTGSDTHAEKLISKGLQECRADLEITTTRLEKLMKDVMGQLVKKSKTATTSEEDIAELLRLQDEWETTRKSLSICSKADTHLKENVSIIDNYATGDATQFMVSTNGKILHGTNRGLGWRTRQVGGYISDSTLVNISRDISNTNFVNTGNSDTSPAIANPPVSNDPRESGLASKYSERYGRGNSL